MKSKELPRRIVYMGKVIKALRNKRMRNIELQEELGIPEKSLNRVLKYLRHMGLVKKEEKKLGRWYWYEEMKEYISKSQYELFMKHSKDLMPSLQMLVQQDFEFFWINPPTQRFNVFPAHIDEKSRVPFVEEHLRTGYPEIYDQLVEFREVKQKEEEMKRALVSKIEKEIESALRQLEPDESKWNPSGIRQSILDALDDDRQKLYLRDFIIEVKEFSADELFESSIRPDDDENAIEIRSEESVGKFHRLREKGENLYRELVGNVYSLLMKSRYEPLKGTCKMCPRVIIGSLERTLKDLQYVLKRIDEGDKSSAKDVINEVLMRLIRLSK